MFLKRGLVGIILLSIRGLGDWSPNVDSGTFTGAFRFKAMTTPRI